MQAGLLKDWITIRKPIFSRDAYGGEPTKWEIVYQGRAWVRFSSGTQKVINGETINTATKKVVMRYKSGFDCTMRIDIEGEQYRISSKDRNREQQSLTFIVELIND